LLLSDLQQEFPDTTGLSSHNLWNMKNFYEFYALADSKGATQRCTFTVEAQYIDNKQSKIIGGGDILH
jgi:hypothetical protein